MNDANAKRLIYLTICIFILLAAVNVYAGEKKEYKWKVDDVITTDRVQDYHISPSGKRLVWTVRQWDLKTHKPYHTVFLTGLDKKGEALRLTRGTNTHTDIQWVPGEKRISFRTDRKFKDTKPGNLWVMPLVGGDAYPVTGFDKGILQYAWIDADNLLFTALEADTRLQKELKEKKDTTRVVEDEAHVTMARLFTYNLKTKKVTRLTDNSKPIYTIFLSPDKKHVIYNVNVSVRYFVNHLNPPKFYLMNLETKETREILEDLRMSMFSGFFEWERDSKGFYFSHLYNTHPVSRMCGVLKIYRYDVVSGSSKEVDLGWDRYAVTFGQAAMVVPGGILAHLVDGARYKIARYTRGKDRWKREWVRGDEANNIDSLKFARDGKTLVYRYSTASLPPRYYLAELKGNRFKKKWEVMDIKSPLFKKPMGKTEIRTWVGGKSEEVEGILYYPVNYEAGKKYPLILMIHGGPFGADMDRFAERLIKTAHLWCERGAFVLKPNYHGSSNYGLEFAESIAGHYYEYEIPDIEAGVDMLIAEGKVDKEKLGIIGHSNGAILGTGLIVNSDRYKVASLSAGDVNWTSDYGHCLFGVTFDDYYFGGPPWERLEHYIEKSPLFRMEKVTTPTLIFHGEKDRSVPYSQGWEFYRALQVIGKAPVRFLSLPGEGHVPRKLGHMRRVQEEVIRWFEIHLFKDHDSGNESLKEGSPLDMLGDMRVIGRFDGLVGIKVKDMLVPEVVEFSDLWIGRFEVTCAQWAAFDKDYRYGAGMGDYPVTGISYERVLEYVVWLGELTGGVYRLPTVKEAEKLYKTPSGNTFDYWAGYALNPDDYVGLLDELKKYKDKPVLLKSVGLFSPKGKGKNLIFDLGGNAAEWVTVKEGEGKVVGGSAVTPGDTKSDQKPPLYYTGFRVVRDSVK